MATDISGHRCSVVAGVHRPARRPGATSVPPSPGVLRDDDLRRRLGDAALARARTLTWDATALGVLAVLHGVVAARH